MVNPKLSTEEKILEAAKEVFHKRGFDGARMQEIADTAGINKALLHYYFRSKDNLFEAVFRDAFARMTTQFMRILMEEGRPLREKLEMLVGFYIDFLKSNSYIPWFILNALYEKPGLLPEILSQNQVYPSLFLPKLKEFAEHEGYECDDPLQLYLNILSLVVFPVIARPLLNQVFGLEDESLQAFYEIRKRSLPDFILNGIKKSNPNGR
jgi:AcrR family transcriptional regulator